VKREKKFFTFTTEEKIKKRKRKGEQKYEGENQTASNTIQCYKIFFTLRLTLIGIAAFTLGKKYSFNRTNVYLNFIFFYYLGIV
jgi:hypothetical protein